MILYKGFPRANGVTDFCDSAVFAGLLSVFQWPGFAMPFYFDQYGNPLRSAESDIPDDKCFDPMTFSRDQLTCLIAGYHAQKNIGAARIIYTKVVENNWLCPNNDLLSPSNRGHINFCVGEKVSWMQDKWLYADVLYSAIASPMKESNQLLCMLMIRDPKWVKLYTRLNKVWRENLVEYWSGWRNEPDLAQHMIAVIEERIK